MNSNEQDAVARYIIAILKSAGLNLAKEIKNQIIKVDPAVTVRELLRQIRSILGLSPNDSLFLYAYGSILQSEDTLGQISQRFKNRIGEGGKLEIMYSEMATFGHDDQ